MRDKVIWMSNCGCRSLCIPFEVKGHYNARLAVRETMGRTKDNAMGSLVSLHKTFT